MAAWGLAVGAAPRDGALGAEAEAAVAPHPRLYFDAAELAAARAARDDDPVRARIWENLIASAEWCRAQPVRREWIATRADDPQYENLYDRFYAAMHDTAIVEHLALASALHAPEADPYFPAARAWALGAAEVWRNEAGNAPDAGKAYAVLRVTKALAVAYDALYVRLSAEERDRIRRTLTEVGSAYAQFFQQSAVAGEGYNKHHGSVEAAPLGIVALAILDEEPAARQWLELAIQKHVDYLLPHALTPSGTSDQSSNFWASTLQYRILFFEPLRRATGRDLLREFPDALPGNMGLAAVAAGQPRELRYNEDQRSVLFGPSYGQINYWSPVLLYLARHHRRSTFQHLALWDESLGSIQRTRYVTPVRKEELLFGFGPYAYLWYDPSVPAVAEDDAPLSFAFPEPEVDEAYLRGSYAPGGIVLGMKKGGLIVHAGGRPVLVDQLPVADVNAPAPAAAGTVLEEQPGRAVLQTDGPRALGLGRQRIELQRPGSLRIERETAQPLSWYFHGDPRREGNAWIWADGTRLEVRRGEIVGVVEDGYRETKKHYGGMQFADPHPFVYPVTTVRPVAGRIDLEVALPGGARATTGPESTEP